MAPRVENNEANRVKPYEPPPPVEQPKPNNPPVVTERNSVLTRQSDLRFYGNQQRDRLERLYGAGAAGLSTMRDVALTRATQNANAAYTQTYLREWDALKNPATSVNPPTNMVEVSLRAENAYRASLAREGFTPLDVRGASVIKAADFLRSSAQTNGDFTTLSPSQINQRIAANQENGYFVRILDSRHLSSGDARLSRDISPHTWVATPEEIAGAKLDTYETMRRVGYSDNYIDWIQTEVAAGRKNLSDFTLVITEANGTTGSTVPSWDVLTTRAQTHPDFAAYNTKPSSFWQDVQNLDYRTELAKFNADRTGYLSSLTTNQQDVFDARRKMDSLLGVNEYFTNDGRTARTDGRNGTFGVREFLIDNAELGEMRRNTFVDLSETGTTNLRTVENAPVITNNPLRLRSEMRSGGIAGGALSAVTSLPQVFDQIGNGDYLGATTTLVTNTGVGTTVGAFSAAGERIIGNSVDDALGRFGTSALSSTSRQVIGRVAGGSVVGGVVNGVFSSIDQIGAYNRGEVTGSQAIGTVTGEVAVGMGAGLAGAAAGAAIGSIIPGAGTIVGGVIGFGVGLAAGYLADKGLRGLGVNTAIANGVTWAIDNAPRAFNAATNFVGEQINNVTSTVSNIAEQATTAVTGTVSNMASGAVNTLRSVFG